MAAWARLVAVTCLAGWAAGQAPASRCAVTASTGGFGDVANFPLHDAAWNYDLPRVKCLVEQAKVRPAGVLWVPAHVVGPPCEGTPVRLPQCWPHSRRRSTLTCTLPSGQCGPTGQQRQHAADHGAAKGQRQWVLAPRQP
jgi:hypothetical protein